MNSNKSAKSAVTEASSLSGLVGEEKCRETIWPDNKSRPSSRWFVELKAKGLIPFHRIGRRVFYDPSEVRRALDKQFRVNIRK